MGFAGGFEPAGGGFQLSFSFRGEGLILLSTISAAVSSALIRRYSAQVSPILLSGWQFFLGASPWPLAGIALGGHWAPSPPPRWAC